MNTGLEQIRQTMADYLCQQGVPAVTAWPAAPRQEWTEPVVVVSVRGCRAGSASFQDYLGERYDEASGRWEERYGKKAELTFGLDLYAPLTPEERIFELCNAQSIGACMENMSLAALRMGLGSLWICDTYFALAELNAWLGGGRQLMAAMALGYPDENPPPRPRKEFDSLVEWRM